MKIAINDVGRYLEVTFCDFENQDIRAHSGLLDEDAAHDLADELQGIAWKLRAETKRDANQILLPFARAA